MAFLVLLITLLLQGTAWADGSLAIHCAADGTYQNTVTRPKKADFDQPHTLVSYAPCPPTPYAVGDPPFQVTCLTQAQVQQIEAIPSQYRKCSDTDADTRMDAVVEMTPAEKAVVDAPAIAAAAEATANAAEVTGNDLCTASLAQLTTRINTERDAINTAIAGAGNVAQLKTAMTTANNTYAAIFRKIVRCTRARLGQP